MLRKTHQYSSAHAIVLCKDMHPHHTVHIAPITYTATISRCSLHINIVTNRRLTPDLAASGDQGLGVRGRGHRGGRGRLQRGLPHGRGSFCNDRQRCRCTAETSLVPHDEGLVRDYISCILIAVPLPHGMRRICHDQDSVPKGRLTMR
jgi:hypothetical protein